MDDSFGPLWYRPAPQRFTSSQLAGLTSWMLLHQGAIVVAEPFFTSFFTSFLNSFSFKHFVNIFLCLSGMPSVSHEGPSLATGEVRQAFGPTLDLSRATSAFGNTQLFGISLTYS